MYTSYGAIHPLNVKIADFQRTFSERKPAFFDFCMQFMSVKAVFRANARDFLYYTKCERNQSVPVFSHKYYILLKE